MSTAMSNTDDARFAWLEEHSTLHKRVEILYVVDGYEVQIWGEDGVTMLSPSYWGATLRAAIDSAMAAVSNRG